MKKQSPILVLGLGNELLCDDAIGIKLVLEFEKQFQSESVHFRTSCSGGLEIIEMLAGYRKVIIIDAIKTTNGIPGSVYHFTPSDFQDTLHVSSFHDVSFMTALKLAAYLDIKVTENIHILAIEIVEDMLFSNEFSSSIKKKYGHIKKKIRDYLDKLIVINTAENYRETNKPVFSDS